MTGWKWRFWAWPRELARCGALGINRRNGDYVLAVNPRACYPRVDDKLQTKRICEAHGIPVPQTYAAIERHGDVRKFLDLVAGRRQFVIKPGRGSEGRGILVVTGHDGGRFAAAGGQTLSPADVRYHLATILSGLYSLGGQPDCAIVEQRIVSHPAFERIAVGGTPDVRIVVYRGVPAMAMVRLPTQGSRGRANLHQGAIAAGIHLRRGVTLGGVLHNRAVSVHPDTGATIDGLEIPFWHRLLAAAMKLADAVELGYLGVDFVLDAAQGPVVLEANARPGLAIQIANRCGLRHRLQWIDAQAEAMRAPDRRLELVEHLADLTG